MTARTTLHCDATIHGDPCPARITTNAASAITARDDATDRGWTTKRSTRGHSHDVRDYCPRCAAVFAATPGRPTGSRP